MTYESYLKADDIIRNIKENQNIVELMGFYFWGYYTEVTNSKDGDTNTSWRKSNIRCCIQGRI